jgi:hypothetical protein
MTEKRCAFRALVGNSDGKRRLHNTDAHVRVILTSVIIRQKDTDWIYLAQDRDAWWTLVSQVMKLWVP